MLDDWVPDPRDMDRLEHAEDQLGQAGEYRDVVVELIEVKRQLDYYRTEYLKQVEVGAERLKQDLGTVGQLLLATIEGRIVPKSTDQG